MTATEFNDCKRRTIFVTALIDETVNNRGPDTLTKYGIDNNKSISIKTYNYKVTITH